MASDVPRIRSDEPLTLADWHAETQKHVKLGEGNKDGRVYAFMNPQGQISLFLNEKVAKKAGFTTPVSADVFFSFALQLMKNCEDQNAIYAARLSIARLVYTRVSIKGEFPDKLSTVSQIGQMILVPKQHIDIISKPQIEFVAKSFFGETLIKRSSAGGTGVYFVGGSNLILKLNGDYVANITADRFLKIFDFVVPDYFMMKADSGLGGLVKEKMDELLVKRLEIKQELLRQKAEELKAALPLTHQLALESSNSEAYPTIASSSSSKLDPLVPSSSRQKELPSEELSLEKLSPEEQETKKELHALLKEIEEQETLMRQIKAQMTSSSIIGMTRIDGVPFAALEHDDLQWILKDPLTLMTLGKMVALDFFIGNSDRLHDTAWNPGNFLFLKKPPEGKLPIALIDHDYRLSRDNVNGTSDRVKKLLGSSSFRRQIVALFIAELQKSQNNTLDVKAKFVEKYFEEGVRMAAEEVVNYFSKKPGAVYTMLRIIDNKKVDPEQYAQLPPEERLRVYKEEMAMTNLPPEEQAIALERSLQRLDALGGTQLKLDAESFFQLLFLIKKEIKK